MPYYPYSFGVMGCPAQVLVNTTSLKLAKRVHSFASDFLTDFENKYSRYNPNSIVSAINAAAGRSAVAVDELTSAMLMFADSMYVESEGRFDITSGVYRKIWDFKSGVIPTQAQIDEIRPFVGWNRVSFNNDEISLPEGMQLDFGGFGKEYAADLCAAKVIQEFADCSGIVNLGGDAAIFGQTDKPWKVGISTPESVQGQFVLNLRRGGVATSGASQRVIEIDGKRYCHILNPKTGWPVQSLSAVTVYAPSCVVAGALTTLAMLRSETEAKTWLSEQEAPHVWFDSLGEYGGSFTDIIQQTNYSSSKS